MSNASTHIRLLPNHEPGVLATWLPVFTRLANRLAEYYFLLRWHCSTQSNNRRHWFEQILSTHPCEERRRKYWRIQADLTMGEWLRTISSRETLWYWGPFRRPVRQGLADALLPSLSAIARNQYESTAVRTRAITALAHLNVEGVEPVMLNIIGDTSKVVRQGAAEVLQQMDFKAANLIPDLLTKLCCKSKSERSCAARTIATLKLAAPELVQQLIVLMHDRNHHTVQVCAYALSELGGKAQEALPALRKLINDPWIPAHVHDEAKKAEKMILRDSAESWRQSLMQELQQYIPFLHDE